MRPPFRGLALVVGASLLLLGSPRPVRAEDAPAGLEEAEAKALCGKLRRRASDWWQRRKRMAMVCPQCKGQGKVRWRKGRRLAIVDCPKCDGHKLFVDKDPYRVCFYEMRSPAFRLMEGSRERVTAEFVRAKEGSPFPTILKRYAIKDVEVVDATHGLVHVEQNKDSVARPQRWIWAEEPGSSADWFLYDESSDGPWPSADVPVPPVAQEPTPPRPVPPPPPDVLPQPVDPSPQAQPEASPDRVDPKESAELILTWAAERSDYEARVIRLQMGLAEVEGHEDKVERALAFLQEVDAWLAEAKPALDRAKADVEEQGLGVRLDDRITVNTNHVKIHRRLKLIEDMFKWVIPELHED